jgi:predicted transcriptional regulator
MIEYTVKELAWLEKVDEKTVRQWVNKLEQCEAGIIRRWRGAGLVHVRRTPGGGIRIVYRQMHPNDRRKEGRVVDDVQSSASSGHP